MTRRAGPELCCRNESLWSSTLKALNVTSYAFDLNLPPSSSSRLPAFSSSAESSRGIPPSFLHLGVLDEDDDDDHDRDDDDQDSEQRKVQEEGSAKPEIYKARRQGNVGTKRRAASGAIRGFMLYDAVGPVRATEAREGEAGLGGEDVPERGERRGDRHLIGETGATREGTDDKRKGGEAGKKGPERKFPPRGENVYWSERMQTGGVWGDGVVHFSSYDWSICGQNLMGASQMYDWLVTLDLR